MSLAPPLGLFGGGGATVVPGPFTVTTQTGTTYTLTLGDAESIILFTNSGAITLTVPPHSSVAFPVGTYIGIIQSGTGQIHVIPGTGVTINTALGTFSRVQFSLIWLIQTTTNTWELAGDTTT